MPPASTLSDLTLRSMSPLWSPLARAWIEPWGPIAASYCFTLCENEKTPPCSAASCAECESLAPFSRRSSPEAPIHWMST